MLFIINYCETVLRMLAESYGIYFLILGLSVLFGYLYEITLANFHGHLDTVVLFNPKYDKITIFGCIMFSVFCLMFFALYITMILANSTITACLMLIMLAFLAYNMLCNITGMFKEYKERNLSK